MRSNVVNSVILQVKSHLTKGADWSQDDYTTAHNGGFVSKTPFNPILLYLHVYLSDTNHIKKVISDHW